MFGIPAPTFTEKTLPDQTGRVHIVTGGYAGVGQELAAILYSKGATVYVAGRSKEKAFKSIDQAKFNHPTSTGRLEFLLLDLNDLASIKTCVEAFCSRESRLDVLVNNAGVMFPPAGTTTKQGHDLQFGTNCLGPHLFTKLLHPILIHTAKSAPPNTVRVLWASSSAIEVMAPPGGIAENTTTHSPKILSSQQTNYGQTKVGNVLLAHETQQYLRQHNIVSVSFNPGNLRTELQRHLKGVMACVVDLTLHPAIYGAYTELYSGWSEDVKPDDLYVMPWGRRGAELVRKDIRVGIERGLAERFWGWCERETAEYA